MKVLHRFNEIKFSEHFWRLNLDLINMTKISTISVCPTLSLKSVGSVLAPVRRFTRKAFQLEYLCWMPVREITEITATITTTYPRKEAFKRKIVKTFGTRLTFWRYEGFAIRSTPSHLMYLRDTEVTPEVLTAVVIKALIPQESLEPCGKIKKTQ